MRLALPRVKMTMQPETFRKDDSRAAAGGGEDDGMRVCKAAGRILGALTGFSQGSFMVTIFHFYFKENKNKA